MPKSKKTTKIKFENGTLSGTPEAITDHLKKISDSLKNGEISVEIKSAKLKGAFCSYSYELKNGPTAGDECTRSGAAIVHADMTTAFDKLGVHLAVICEEILPSEIDIDNIPDPKDESLKKNEKALALKIDAFHVNAFRIEGSGENEGVVLIGTKRLSTLETLKLETPRVKWDSTYEFINELMGSMNTCTSEVEQYMHGKAAPKYVEQDLFEGNTEGNIESVKETDANVDHPE
jgi:hypothetical protein